MVMENPGKMNFPGKSWKTCKKLKVMEKKFIKLSKNFTKGLFKNNFFILKTLTSICKVFRIS